MRDTVRMLCDVIWSGGRTKPGQHVWSIPVDKQRDFDCILHDAIDELVKRRTDQAAIERQAVAEFIQKVKQRMFSMPNSNMCWQAFLAEADAALATPQEARQE